MYSKDPFFASLPSNVAALVTTSFVYRWLDSVNYFPRPIVHNSNEVLLTDASKGQNPTYEFCEGHSTQDSRTLWSQDRTQPDRHSQTVDKSFMVSAPVIGQNNRDRPDLPSGQPYAYEAHITPMPQLPNFIVPTAQHIVARLPRLREANGLPQTATATDSTAPLTLITIATYHFMRELVIGGVRQLHGERERLRNGVRAGSASYSHRSLNAVLDPVTISTAHYGPMVDHREWEQPDVTPLLPTHLKRAVINMAYGEGGRPPNSWLLGVIERFGKEAVEM